MKVNPFGSTSELFKKPPNTQRLLADSEAIEMTANPKHSEPISNANLPQWMRLYQEILLKIKDIEDLCTLMIDVVME